jgi:hypothetical protein
LEFGTNGRERCTKNSVQRGEREVHKESRTQISVAHLGEVNPLIEKLPTLTFEHPKET